MSLGSFATATPSSSYSQPSGNGFLSRNSAFSDDFHLRPHPAGDSQDAQESENPTDISIAPETLVADQGDATDQSEIMNAMVGNPDPEDTSLQRFLDMQVHRIKLSTLESYFTKGEERVVGLLDDGYRHTIEIDDHFQLKPNSGKILVDASYSTIDYHLTVANCIGFSSLLPNMLSNSGFEFCMCLKKPFRDFRGKHAMLGFDPAGCMLYIGRCLNEDVFLAMAPNDFLDGHIPPSPAGHSTGSSVMSKRHYRQMVMMIVHFLAQIPNRAFIVLGSVYDQDLDSPDPNFGYITDALFDDQINLNFEHLQAFDELLVDGYDTWVDNAPADWKADGFLEHNSPIIVTSRFGQDARIALRGNEDDEAEFWQLKRDYTKIAFLTVAIATSIECDEIYDWDPISIDILRKENPDGLYRTPTCQGLLTDEDLENLSFTSDDGRETPVYNIAGDHVPRRRIRVDRNQPPCGVLVDLPNIQQLFNPNPIVDISDDSPDLSDSHLVNIYAYPLGFLRTAGNIQADGIPHCFYPVLTDINKKVRKNHPVANNFYLPPTAPSDDERDDYEGLSDLDEMDVDDDDVELDTTPSHFQVVKPVSSQFYNNLTHRVASRAGRHDSQHGKVTAAISGAFATGQKDRTVASKIQSCCDRMLPSEVFHERITSVQCPTACRAELVYSIDVRALKEPTGASIFKNIMVPLAQSWAKKDIREVIMNYLVVLKPNVFPALYDWVSYPITILIKKLFQLEMGHIDKKVQPSPFRIELLASLERLLCFCHTGNTSVFATSLMGQLNLSRSAVTDGFPIMSKVFKQPNIIFAMQHGYEINPCKWPIMRNGYPAIASKRAQVLTYSLPHFMAYQARFRIDFAFIINPTKVYSCVSGPKSNKAMQICNIAFDAFFDDVRQLVAEGVRRDIKLKVATASVGSQDQVNAVTEYGNIREDCLNLWLSMKFPLAYGENGGRNTFTLLLRAIAPSGDKVEEGLPNWCKNSFSPSSFVDQLVSMSRPFKPSQPSAPVLQTGSFLPVLKIAHVSILSLFEDKGPDDQEKLLKNFLRHAIRIFHVHFFPYHPSNSRTVGSPYRKPVWNSWAYLGEIDKEPQIPLDDHTSSASTSRVLPETVALNRAIADDRNASWGLRDLTSGLGSIRHILNKVTLPEDFKLPSASDESYVNETYEWVQTNYRGKKVVHHLALIVAIVVSYSMLPNLFTPTGKKKEFRNATTRAAVRNVYNTLDWVHKEGRGGMVDKPIFVGMLTSFIIAIYEEQSPLRKYMKTTRSGAGLGDAWTSKNSVKGITFNLFIRLGIFYGVGPSAYDRGSFGKDWGCFDKKHLAKLHKELCDSLSKDPNKDPFGRFDALALLIGDRNARFFAKLREIPFRPPFRRMTKTEGNSSKSNLFDPDVIVIDD